MTNKINNKTLKSKVLKEFKFCTVSITKKLIKEIEEKDYGYFSSNGLPTLKYDDLVIGNKYYIEVLDPLVDVRVRTGVLLKKTVKPLWGIGQTARYGFLLELESGATVTCHTTLGRGMSLEDCIIIRHVS